MTAVPAAALAVLPDGGRRRRAAGLAVAGGLLAVAALVGVSVGAVTLDPGAVAATLLQQVGVDAGTPLSGARSAVLLEYRLPRVVLAALVGGLLAVAGAAYQGVFRNPLADPYLLGAAAGAGLGATVVIVFTPAVLGASLAVPVAAFAGALTGVGLAYGLGSAAGRLSGGPGGTATLLLAGVAVTSFLTAIQTLVQQAGSDSLRQVYSWILGQLVSAEWGTVRTVLPYTVVSMAVLLLCGRALDVLAVGDDEARVLGVRPQRIRFVVLLAASLATASAVAVAGLIGFVGLVVPHVVRRLAGASYATLLPVCALGGAAFLVLADVVARAVLAPAEIPIGVVTAFVGAPFFAALLRIGSPP